MTEQMLCHFRTILYVPRYDLHPRLRRIFGCFGLDRVDRVRIRCADLLLGTWVFGCAAQKGQENSKLFGAIRRHYRHLSDSFAVLFLRGQFAQLPERQYACVSKKIINADFFWKTAVFFVTHL